jgi:hypothetical protein
MQSLADRLPPEIARQIHPDWRKNEAGYWSVRDQLLAQYRDQWIGFADGAVVASGTSPVAVFHAAAATGRHPFVTCVGREDEPTRMRRLSFPTTTPIPASRCLCCLWSFARLAGRRESFWIRSLRTQALMPVHCPGSTASGSNLIPHKAGRVK